MILHLRGTMLQERFEYVFVEVTLCCEIMPCFVQLEFFYYFEI